MVKFLRPTPLFLDMNTQMSQTTDLIMQILSLIMEMGGLMIVPVGVTQHLRKLLYKSNKMFVGSRHEGVVDQKTDEFQIKQLINA